MAYLKPKNIHGQTYWYVVESRRINGQVKTINLAYLVLQRNLIWHYDS